MKKRVIIFIPVLFGILGLLVWYLQGKTVAVLQPQGLIASQQRDLFVFAILLSLVVLIPVFAFTIYVVWRYRASNDNPTYQPNWNNNKKLSLAWFLVTVIIIGAIGVASWKTTHALDPYRPLNVDAEPMVIQVVALQWKWLFLYPDQALATVNYVAFPEKTPVVFELTADAPMNSFWIPQLAGQIYAMEGMVTKLHLMADTTGEYKGSPAEISGEGFADMMFTAKSMSKHDFNNWVQSSQASSKYLDDASYTALAKPGSSKPITYAAYQPGLYDKIVMKYMPDDNSHSIPEQLGVMDDQMHHMPGM